ncbi:tRNA adenosine(34) deaminase TadA [Candidatus Pseudothioglobus singularis]|uniref:tRNA-specific adenosine deaminase n=1 Tax=Candidatus Pseudothioglobus singularis PS1 TaxID=1125411 RepID=A0A0M5KS02_9GAMM|nr:tRNA adenosine(34) deaminase TadA [Candidatus Pseudothioglobus singularis]ALE02328.1 CMP deaminase [Candidatus Pseudothioglobus singularis PS1]
MVEDEKWMKFAIQEAEIAMEKGEVPVGSVLVHNNQIIAKAHNCPISKNDPSAHAEIEVLRKSGQKLLNYRLPKTTMYVTLEPCAMCLGAMIHARIERIVFGALDPKSGVCGSAANLLFEPFFNHKIEVNGGVLEQDCKKVLQSFFKLRRK